MSKSIKFRMSEHQARAAIKVMKGEMLRGQQEITCAVNAQRQLENALERALKPKEETQS